MDWKTPGFAMWFLWVLFIYRLLFPVIVKIKYILPFSVIVALLVGFIPQIGSSLGLSRIFCFLPFYLLGYFVNNSENKTMVAIKKRILMPLGFKDVAVLSAIVVVWAILLFYKPQMAFYTTFNYNYNGNWICLFVRIAMYLTSCLIAFYVLRMFPNRPTFYTKYGGRTMGVYLLHGIIVLSFAYKVFQPFELETHLNQFLMVILPVSISLLLFAKPIDKIVKRVF